jgi:hypothetical protein
LYSRCIVKLVLNHPFQAQKFGSFADDDDDDVLDEESLLETPLDKIEPYSMFKHVLLGMKPIFTVLITTIFKLTFFPPAGLQQEQPQLYENLIKILNPDEQQVIQAVFHEADAQALAAANSEAAAAAGTHTNGA